MPPAPARSRRACPDAPGLSRLANARRPQTRDPPRPGWEEGETEGWNATDPGLTWARIEGQPRAVRAGAQRARRRRRYWDRWLSDRFRIRRGLFRYPRTRSGDREVRQSERSSRQLQPWRLPRPKAVGRGHSFTRRRSTFRSIRHFDQRRDPNPANMRPFCRFERLPTNRQLNCRNRAAEEHDSEMGRNGQHQALPQCPSRTPADPDQERQPQARNTEHEPGLRSALNKSRNDSRSSPVIFLALGPWSLSPSRCHDTPDSGSKSA